MAKTKLIAAKTYCSYHNISVDFIKALREHDLIELVVEKKTAYIPFKELPQLETIIRLHNDLQVNPGDIPLVLQLLQQLRQKDQELKQLKNLVSFYAGSSY